MRASPTDVRESVIEEAFVDACERQGWLCEKFVTPGKKGPPDRLVTLRCSCMRLAEIKRPKGGVVKSWQERDHKRRRLLGVKVEVPHTLEDVTTVVTRWRTHQISCPMLLFKR